MNQLDYALVKVGDIVYVGNEKAVVLSSEEATGGIVFFAPCDLESGDYITLDLEAHSPILVERNGELIWKAGK